MKTKPPGTPSSKRSTRQSGQAGRRALLVLAGLAAGGAGAWWAWRRAPHEATANAPTTGSSSDVSSGTPTPSTQAAAPAASTPLIQGDQLTSAFWQQAFDAPDGAVVSMSKFKGRPLLINFWATWCPPCVKELPELDRFQHEFAGKNWQVLGLAIDGPTPVKQFLAKVKVGYEVGLAGFGGTELAQALGNEAGGLPFSVIIDAQGHVVHRKIGATHFDELATWAAEISGH